MHSKQLLPISKLLELLDNQRFGVEYQPIIDVITGQIFAYESLARFFSGSNQSVPPDLVYASLHQSPLTLFQVEYQQKKLQLANAPNNADIFVNLDQDSYSACGEISEHNPFIELFNNYQKAEITVELIENSELNDAIMSLAMIDSLAKNNISTAIDDLCNPQSMISTSVIQLVDYIKLDKHVLSHQHNEQFMLLVNYLVQYAHAAGKKVILEGVETENDLQFANDIKVDFVQGFYYKKHFVHATF